MPQRLLSQLPSGSLVQKAHEIVPSLVGHTIEEIERELILDTLVYHCGNRSRAADVLGISIRTMRNKIHAYETQGVAVPKHGQPPMTAPAPRVPKPRKH